MVNPPAASRRRPFARKLPAILVLVVVLLAALAFAGKYVAERRIAALLGPRAQVGQVSLGFKEVVLSDVKITGAEGMEPASARRVVAEPEWRSLLGREAVFRRITVEDFDFTVLRGADGDMQIAPPRCKRHCARPMAVKPARARRFAPMNSFWTAAVSNSSMPPSPGRPIAFRSTTSPPACGPWHCRPMASAAT